MGESRGVRMLMYSIRHVNSLSLEFSAALSWNFYAQQGTCISDATIILIPLRKNHHGVVKNLNISTCGILIYVDMIFILD